MLHVYKDNKDNYYIAYMRPKSFSLIAKLKKQKKKNTTWTKNEQQEMKLNRKLKHEKCLRSMKKGKNRDDIM